MPMDNYNYHLTKLFCNHFYLKDKLYKPKLKCSISILGTSCGLIGKRLQSLIHACTVCEVKTDNQLSMLLPLPIRQNRILFTVNKSTWDTSSLSRITMPTILDIFFINIRLSYSICKTFCNYFTWKIWWSHFTFYAGGPTGMWAPSGW